MRNFESFNRISKSILSENFDFEGYFTFIALNETFKDFQSIFQEMWRKPIYNCNILHHKNGKIVLETFFPFKLGSCRNVAPEVINNFNFHEWTTGKFFPYKLKIFMM